MAYGTALSYAVQHSSGGSVLVVYAAGSRAENWLGLPAAVVTPARVAAAIRRAVTAGWLPTGPGRVVAELPVVVGR